MSNGSFEDTILADRGCDIKDTVLSLHVHVHVHVCVC